MVCVIVTGGESPGEEFLRSRLKYSELVIGVDGAADIFYRMEIVPDVLIGDFDTADPSKVSYLENIGSKVIRLLEQKNETDTEAAIDYAVSAGASEIVILGALGKRIDHTLSNIMMLIRAESSGVKCSIADESCELFVCGKYMRLDGHSGQTVSILPLTGEIVVSSLGLMYPLNDLKLCWGSSRGISNIISADSANISVSGGYALIVMFTRNL